MGAQLPVTLFLDANVLYSACCRDLLLELALAGLCDCRWSEQVLAETKQALLRERPDIDAASLSALFKLMNQACPEALRASSVILRLPPENCAHPCDLHLVASAQAAQADTILSFNLKHFHAERLARLGLIVMSPDQWLCDLTLARPLPTLAAFERCRKRLKHPALSRSAHRKAMRSAGLICLATHLKELYR
jgi:hypothetical protein